MFILFINTMPLLDCLRYQLKSYLNIHYCTTSFGALYKTRFGAEIKEVINKHHRFCRSFSRRPSHYCSTKTCFLCSHRFVSFTKMSHNCLSESRLDSHDSKPHKLPYTIRLYILMLVCCLFMCILYICSYICRNKIYT